MRIGYKASGNSYWVLWLRTCGIRC